VPLAVSTRTPSRMFKPATASKSINSIVLQVERHGYSPNLKGSTSELPPALTEQAHWQAGSLSDIILLVLRLVASASIIL
jgi:hypothetical protein